MSEGEQKSIGEKSTVQIGLIILLVSFFCGAAWWASAMQSKLDTVIEEVRSAKTFNERVMDHESRLKWLESKCK